MKSFFVDVLHVGQGWLARKSWSRLGLLLLGCLWSLGLGGLFASLHAQQPYPPFLDAHLNDYGQILSKAEAQTVRTTLGKFQTETGVQVVVMTMNSVQDYRTGDKTVESFATNLFNTWGIGDRTRNDGILLLVAPGDRKVRIELGKGYPDESDAIAQRIINTDMLPSFRDGEISAGILKGVDGIVREFDPRSLNSAQGLISQPSSGVPDEVNDSSGVGAGLVGSGSLLALVTGTGLWLKQYLRFRSRKCPRCGSAMRRLEESEEDPYLKDGQRCEESLRSLDYDVWLCPSCGHHQVKRYNQGSRFRRCPGCGFKTMEVWSKTTRQPTYDDEGEKEIHESCQYCHRAETRYASSPRLTRSTSSDSSNYFSSDSDYSSSDSYDGGSSDGGGASGDW